MGKNLHNIQPKATTRKKTLLVAAFMLFTVFFLVSHELSARYFQDQTCVICHEMKEPIDKWKKSGVAVNHGNCAGCHFETGLKGMLAMNQSAIRLFFVHFQRDPNEPIKPLEEPIILEEGLEPGYWSRVPNSRCYQCKDAKNHKEIDQPRIHKKLVESIATKPCKDCHNHTMRKGQKFFEKITTEGGRGSS